MSSRNSSVLSFKGNQTLIMSACMLGNSIVCDFLFATGTNGKSGNAGNQRECSGNVRVVHLETSR